MSIKFPLKCQHCEKGTEFHEEGNPSKAFCNPKCQEDAQIQGVVDMKRMLTILEGMRGGRVRTREGTCCQGCGRREAIFSSLQEPGLNLCGNTCHDAYLWFQLGMKRKIDEAVRKISLTDIPDEVLGLMLLNHYFDYRLEGEKDIHALMELREVNSKLRRVVDEIVLPSLIFVSGPVLNQTALSNLRALREMVVQGPVKMKNWKDFKLPLLLPNFTKLSLIKLNSHTLPTNLPQLTQITDLSVRNCSFKTWEIQLPSLVNLKRLQYYRSDWNSGSEIEDDDLMTLTNLTTLSIPYAPGYKLGKGFLPILTNLTALDISDTMSFYGKGLVKLSNLTALSLLGCGYITNENISGLTNLKILSLAYTSNKSQITDPALLNMTQLTQLNLFDGPRGVTHNVLKNMVLLKLLIVRDNDRETKEFDATHLGDIPNLVVERKHTLNYSPEYY